MSNEEQNLALTKPLALSSYTKTAIAPPVEFINFCSIIKIYVFLLNLVTYLLDTVLLNQS